MSKDIFDTRVIFSYPKEKLEPLHLSQVQAGGDREGDRHGGVSQVGVPYVKKQLICPNIEQTIIIHSLMSGVSFEIYRLPLLYK